MSQSARSRGAGNDARREPYTAELGGNVEHDVSESIVAYAWLGVKPLCGRIQGNRILILVPEIACQPLKPSSVIARSASDEAISAGARGDCFVSLAMTDLDAIALVMEYLPLDWLMLGP